MARGHSVAVFAAEKDVARSHGALERREWEGITVHELVNNLCHDDFRETYAWEAAERAFERVLDLEKPDLVHAMHLLYLSSGCLESAARRGIPVLFTLHDFWLQCPRMGQLLHADGSLCATIDFARCGTSGATVASCNSSAAAFAAATSGAASIGFSTMSSRSNVPRST